MRPLATALLAAALTCAAGGADAGVRQFKAERAAQEHCPKDEIVWGSDRGIYYTKHSRFYGKSKGGRYVCRREAERDGWRVKQAK